MATVPLTWTGATMDSVSQRVVLHFVDAMPPDHPDPVNFRSTVNVTLHLPPGQVDIDPIEYPDESDAESTIEPAPERPALPMPEPHRITDGS